MGEHKESRQRTKSYPDYYLGLDLGTSSVGWAVTDESYKLLKFNQKSMWGIRLFDEGKTAAERRTYRSARRRLSRRNQRIALLQELFDEEISKVDPGFFQRLNDSFFQIEDKAVHQKNSLFCDPNYTDREYHKEFPTIGHLKVALMEQERAFDVRLVYLAIANILKHRGHFIFEGKDLQSVRSFETALDTFLEQANSYYGTELDEESSGVSVELTVSDREQLKLLLQDRTKGMKEKQKEILALFNAKDFENDRKSIEKILHTIVGAKINTKNIVDEEAAKEKENEISFSFRDATYDENRDAIAQVLEERMAVIDGAKALHDWALLEAILEGEESIAKSDVARYEQHKADLKVLKRFVKDECNLDTYRKIFRAKDQDANYYAYITGKEEKEGKAIEQRERCSQEELCAFLAKELKSVSVGERNRANYERIVQRLEDKSFLPKQRAQKNAIVPYQLHENDLRAILARAKQYLPFLSEVDETGYCVSDKILKIMSFRIPYYVGPLNRAHRSRGDVHNWIVRKGDPEDAGSEVLQSGEAIRPWNFDELVDRERSAKQFIRRMTSKCTYLIGADVLPKRSLLYAEFMMHNELNNVRIDGEKLTKDAKARVIEGLFAKHKKVTKKKLIDFLWREGFVTDRHVDVTGMVDNEFKASLQAEIDFKQILNKEHLSDSDKEMAESIIHDITVFADQKALVKNRIKSKYPSLTQEQVKELLRLSYKDWGNLSRELLTEIEGTDPATGEVRTIMQALRETDRNLMELLSASGGFNVTVSRYNAAQMSEDEGVDYKTLDALYISPPVKRSLWQTIKIAEELRNMIGKDPAKVFVEVQREEGEKKQTKSRKDMLIDLYKSIKTEEAKGLYKELESRESTELNSRALYLYYTQMGRCMYSGELIDRAMINDKNLYDLDHIIPQSLKKDDSLDNLVLVKKHINQAIKKDHYPVPHELQTAKVKELWKCLLDQGLISKSKYERLMRTVPLTDQERADFINRQLVETRQVSKAAIQVLQRLFPNTDIVYSKAGNVSDFRKQFHLIKARDVNDLHHAKDAYLNIVVGNFFDTKFTKSPLHFIRQAESEEQPYSINPEKMYHFDVVRGDTAAWIAARKGRAESTIDTVQRMMKKHDIQFTRMSYEETGAISDLNPMRKTFGQLPLKKGEKYDINKYGGYNKVKGAYFAIVEHTEKGKRIRTIEPVAVHRSSDIAKDPKQLDVYLVKDLKLVEPTVIVPKLKMKSKVEVDGFPCFITGRTGDSLAVMQALQLVLTQDQEHYVKRIGKYLQRAKLNRKKNEDAMRIGDQDGITKAENLALYDTFVQKLGKTRYSVKLEKQATDLLSSRDKFEGLSLEEQASVLFEILKLMQCNRMLSNLKSLGLAKNAGSILINKKIDSFKSFKIINQSITGLFCQEVVLK